MKLTIASLIILALSTLQTLSARGDDFGCIARWNSITDARQDVAALAEMKDDDFNVKQFVQDHVILDLKVWRNSQDTTDQDGNPVHNYLPGYFAFISANRRIAAIENSSAVQVCINITKMNNNEGGFVVLSNYSNAILKDVRFEPVFMGMNLPWANW